MSKSISARMLLGALSLGALLASGAARADRVYWSVGIDAPHSGVRTHLSNTPPPRVVHAPPLVYGAPVVYAPRHYHYAPQPVIVVKERRRHRRDDHHHHHGHGHR